MAGQPGPFDLDARYAALSAAGDPLVHWFYLRRVTRLLGILEQAA